MLRNPVTAVLFCVALLTACEEPAPIVSSSIIINAVIHNGSGGEPFQGAVRIDGGRIRTGYYADLVMFDPATIEDTVTTRESAAFSVSIKKVWVNGELAFDNGQIITQGEY